MSLLYTSKITNVAFSVYNSDEIRKESNVEITNSDLFNNSVPKQNGVYDTRLGTTDASYICGTCELPKSRCLGHDGHISLNYPLRSPLFYDAIKKMLKIVCFKCGGSMIDPSEWEKLGPKKRFSFASKRARASTKPCPTCNTAHPNIIKDPKNSNNILVVEGTERKLLYPHMIRNILSRVPESLCKSLGLSCHPSAFILDAIKVPSVNIRPDIKKQEGGRSNNDDITVLIQCLIKLNNAFPAIISGEIDQKTGQQIVDLESALYNLIRGGNINGAGVAKAGGNLLVSLVQRLKGKNGQLRRNTLGKRVHNVSRTVIGCKNAAAVDGVIFPLAFARNLVIYEKAHKINLERLSMYVVNGRDKYPGARKVIKCATGVEYNVETAKNISLEIGDTVVRDIITGDFMNFNRQPTLTISSISAVKIIVNEDPNSYIFGMNVSACPFFSADFDGDAMNGILNSSQVCQFEQSSISAMSQWFISHTNSSPMTGQIDDGIIGCAMLTLGSTRFNKLHAMRLFANTNYIPDFSSNQNATSGADFSNNQNANLSNNQIYTGREIMSKVMSQYPVDFERAPAWYNPNKAAFMKYDPSDIRVVVRGGNLVSGVLDKKTVGKGANGGLYHLVANEYGSQAAMKLIWDMQQMSIKYMLSRGFTIGPMDIIIPESNRVRIEELNGNVIMRSLEFARQMIEGNIIPPVNKTIRQFYEEGQIAILLQGDEPIIELEKGTRHMANNLNLLISTESKGKQEQRQNIVSNNGQKLINGERLYENFGFGRTSCYYKRFDINPEARGYVSNSYSSGCSPQESIALAQNARFDLITKALMTSVTGEQNRKSIKNLESIIVNNFRSAAKHNFIVQIAYGEDFVDARALKRVKFATVSCSNETFAALTAGATIEYSRLMAEDRAKYRSIWMRLEQMTVKDTLKDERSIPCDIARIAIKCINEANKTGTQSACSAKESCEIILDFRARLKYIFVNSMAETTRRDIHAIYEQACWLVSMSLLIELRPEIIAKKNISRPVLESILAIVKLQYLQSLVDPGCAVGIIAAQSFSEPLTQYMLDAHHRSAGGGTSKNNMIRTKEVLGVKAVADLSAPTTYLPLLDEISRDKNLVQVLANNIEELQLSHFCFGSAIFFEKIRSIVHPAYIEENALVESFIKNNPLLRPPNDLINWCIRFHINKSQLIIKNISMECIIKRLRKLYPQIYVVYTPENAPMVILRVYMRNDLFKTGLELADIEEFCDTLASSVVRGIKGIYGTSIMRNIRGEIKDDGSIGKEENTHCIIADGVNIEDILKLKHVNWQQCVSDSVMETYKMFGIEAARLKIIFEMKQIIECSYRHYAIYADEITQLGVPTSVDRSGLEKRESANPLLNIGTAAPVAAITNAAIYGVNDKVRGMTALSVIGALPAVGTRYNKIVVNEDIMRRFSKSNDELLNNM